MRKLVKRLIQMVLARRGYKIESSELLSGIDAERSLLDFELVKRLGHDQDNQLIKCYQQSRSQLRQDLFVLSWHRYKTDGFFVEFGATNGVELSNTFLLEKKFQWNGILAEPAMRWQKDLKSNRSCSIETDCVWGSTGSILVFNETDEGEFSTINSFSAEDGHRNLRQNGKKYEVRTISLNDLLAKFNAPRHIDYLSIDTEGSEYEILKYLDFSTYSFEVITVEHNYTPARQLIFNLLTNNGYRRMYEDLSLWDDWYVKIH